ncbi:MAG: GNAT family N-acetyltransferase [Acidiferrobacterales bacterium]
MELEVVRDLQQLALLGAAWNEAVEASGFDSIFLTHEWAYAWAKNFAQTDALNIVIAREGNRICGIMPLLRERRRVGPLTLTVLRSMTNLQSYKYGFVLPQNRGQEVFESMLRLLPGICDWDLMELDYVPDDAQVVTFSRQMGGKKLCGARDEIHMESPYVAIEGAWEEYLDARNKKVRKNWDYFERRLQKEGSIDLIEIADGQGLDQAVLEAFEIEKSSWKGDAGTAIGASPAEATFYLELARAMSQRQNFRLFFLVLDGKKIAFDYCLPYKQSFNVLKTGYDPVFAKNSPGRVLRKSVLRSLYQNGSYSIYDLLGARDTWKEEWTQSVRTLVRLRLYNRKPVALVRYAAGCATDQTKQWLRRHPLLFSAVKQLRQRLDRRSGRPPASDGGQSQSDA